MKKSAFLGINTKLSASPAMFLKISTYILLLIVLTFSFSAQAVAKQTLKVKYYPTCFEPISTLNKEARELSLRTAQGALVGSLAGAAAGLLTGKSENILKGAALGLVAGATVGYIVTAELQAKNLEERFATYEKFLDQDYSTLNKAVSSAKVTAKCYSQAYTKLEKAYQAGRISSGEMRERVTEIRDGSVFAKGILKYYKDASVANIEQFEGIQVFEQNRTTDRPSAKLSSDYARKLTENKRVVTLAEVTDKMYDQTLVNANIMLEVLQAKITIIQEFLA
ncbi:MAG: glycine zipper family protein [Deltaproteobacteria bacterium]|jgi:hypothetical protein|nr:glycine zipper family protein [Deltaproteobacteria bacterium]